MAHQAEDGPAPTWCRPGPLVVLHEAQSRLEGLLTQSDCRNQIHYAPETFVGPILYNLVIDVAAGQPTNDAIAKRLRQLAA